MVPTLTLLARLPQKSAQGIALAVMVPMAFVGAIRYTLNPENVMDFRLIGWMALGGIVGAAAGGWLVNLPVVSGTVLRRAFAIVLILTGLRMLSTSAPQTDESSRIPPGDHRPVRPSPP